MKKKTKFMTLLLCTAFSLSMMADGAAAVQKDSAGSEEQEIRVLVTGEKNNVKKVKEQHKEKWDFGTEGFTMDVSQTDYNKLKGNKQLEIKKVPVVTISRPQATAVSAAAAVYPSMRVPWGIKAVYNDSSLQTTSGGNGTKIAVLDTGTTTSHIDLAANVEQCKDFTSTTATIVNNSCTDRNGHGTHVSGTALANGGSDGLGIYGVAPEAELWAYKVLGDDGSGYSDDIAGAIRHAADQKTATGTRVIISMSLGSAGKDTLITNAVNYAYSKGLLVIAAAGNSGYAANTIGYPGALPNAVAVAALENRQENGTYRVANFSSRGNPNTDGDFVIGEKDVEISAPGASIESTWIDGGYNTISGTSMATPHVSGLAAKIWSANPGLTHAQVRSQLQSKARVYDIKGGYGSATGDDYASGFGFARVK
ncbi:S8 family peptidase [Bacillus sp. V5-8f]|uniref:S8 family peptidase n=1 Tax=Bacillus sp. V5-8f TaxID=2053044 RepID=UPI000C788842|nr:S8 family peptidase [Bacillus sp. V5-8f]PLT35232.1 peptidase S8 [Bacillus sp. V5-8f]